MALPAARLSREQHPPGLNRMPRRPGCGPSGAGSNLPAVQNLPPLDKGGPTPPVAAVIGAAVPIKVKMVEICGFCSVIISAGKSWRQDLKAKMAEIWAFC